MKLNINSANQQNNFLKLSTSVREAQEAAKAKETQKVDAQTAVKSSVSLERTESADTLSFGSCANNKEFSKENLKSVAPFFLAGFALNFCPGIFLVAAGAFLFSNKGQSFMDKLIDGISGDKGVLGRLQQQMNANMQTEKAQTTQDNTTVDKVENKTENKATNPIQNTQKAEEAKKEQELTPYEKAQLRYSKAQNYQERAVANLANKEQSQRLAEEKLQLAEAKLEKAQIEYDKAKAEVKMQMTDRMMKLAQSVETKRANANIAKEKTDVARTILDEAGLRVAKAQRALEDLQAEEIVNID